MDWPGPLTPPATPDRMALRRVASAPPSTPSPQRQRAERAPDDADAARLAPDDGDAAGLELELLGQLPIGALRRRALVLGVGPSLVEETIDTSDSPREDLVALLVRAQAQATRRAAGVGPPARAAVDDGRASRGEEIVRVRRRGSPARHPARAYGSPRGIMATSPRAFAVSPRRLSAGSPVRRGRTAWDQVHVGVTMEEYDVVTLEVPRSEWQTEVVDVERTVIESHAVPHAVVRTRIVVRSACLPNPPRAHPPHPPAAVRRTAYTHVR